VRLGLLKRRLESHQICSTTYVSAAHHHEPGTPAIPSFVGEYRDNAAVVVSAAEEIEGAHHPEHDTANRGDCLANRLDLSYLGALPDTEHVIIRVGLRYGHSSAVRAAEDLARAEEYEPFADGLRG
jgi:hypothetical protein